MPLRLSTRRNKVFFLYEEKSCPVCSRSRIIILSRLLLLMLSISRSIFFEGINWRKWISLAGNSSTGATMSAITAFTALRGILSNFAVSGSCTSTIPFFSLMALIPRLPSDPIPERITPILFSFLSSAKERKKISIGNRKPCVSIGANR